MIPLLLLSMSVGDIVPAQPVVRVVPAVSCPAKVIALWDSLVEQGCRLPGIEDRLPISLRLLRNTPFAERAYAFKSAELQTFFKKAKQGCKSAWYTPRPGKVTLQGKDLDCATKLRSTETKERKKSPIPALMEVFLIENVPGELIGEMRRTIDGNDRDGRAHIHRYEDGRWRVMFNSVFRTEDGDTTESSVVVTCDSEGKNCRVDMAG